MLLLLRQPQTLLSSLHSLYPKPVLALQLPHSMSNETVGRTPVHRPRQCLFRPYPKPTPYLYPYLCLCLCNSYYVIKSTFDTSTNSTLYRLHKPMFRHRHNQLCRYTTSVNIPRWIPHRLYRLSPLSQITSPCSPTTSTTSYKTLLWSTFLLQFCVLNHMYSTRLRTMARHQLTLEDF